MSWHQIQTKGLFRHRVFKIAALAALITITTIYLIEPDLKISSARLPFAYSDIRHAGQDNSSFTAEIACKFPKLMIVDPLIKPYLEKYEPIQCSKEKNWVYTTGDGKFYIDHDMVHRHGEIRCEYFRLTRITDKHFEEVPLGVFRNGTELDGCSFVAKCRANDNSTYENVHASVAPDEALKCRVESRRETLSKRKLDVNVLVFLMDSMSHMSFLRNVPNFTNFLIQKMQAHIMNGFNTVGDGTQFMEIPMLTGQFPTELPEARERFPDAEMCDAWPILFKNFSAAGYVTTFLEEGTTVFNYFYKGFRKPFADYSLYHTMMKAVKKRKKSDYDYCLGDSTNVAAYLKFWREIQTVYGALGGRHFSWFFLNDLSHDANDPTQMIDGNLAAIFDELFSRGYLNDTFLIVMGDHGLRFGKIRQTQPGKLEERLPFLALIPPPWFRDRFPKSERNLRINRNRLVTAFDLHETLKQLLDFGDVDGGEGSLKKRGISLFKEIPATRTCQHADIKPHFCSCMDWSDVLENETAVVAATQHVIDYFNNETKKVPGMCAELKVDKILSARAMVPKSDVMAYRESLDSENRVPDMSGSKTPESVIFQVRFLATPGGGDFEASVTYYVTEKEFMMSSTDVSRLNWYSDQAGCVLGNDLKYLRMFCYCKK